jgi:hypothetical protein
MANWLLHVYSVFLIAGTNTFLRLVHFNFGLDYAEYMNATSETAQRAIVADEDKDTFVYMRTTKWFNLQSHGGRKSALCHILSLIRWHDQQNTLFQKV